MMGASEESARIDPADIAKAFVYLSEQGKSCWTQGAFLALGVARAELMRSVGDKELDLRPSAEKF